MYICMDYYLCISYTYICMQESYVLYTYVQRRKKKLDKNWLSPFLTFNHSVAYYMTALSYAHVRLLVFIFFAVVVVVCLFVGVRVWRNTLYALMLFGLTLKASPAWLSFIFGDGYGFFMPSLRFFPLTLIPKEIKNTKNTAPCYIVRVDRIGLRWCFFFHENSTICWCFWDRECTKNFTKTTLDCKFLQKISFETNCIACENVINSTYSIFGTLAVHNIFNSHIIVMHVDNASDAMVYEYTDMQCDTLLKGAERSKQSRSSIQH